MGEVGIVWEGGEVEGGVGWGCRGKSLGGRLRGEPTLLLSSFYQKLLDSSLVRVCCQDGLGDKGIGLGARTGLAHHNLSPYQRPDPPEYESMTGPNCKYFLQI